MSFFMYLSSKDSTYKINVHENNAFSDFTIELHKEHIFEDYERWNVALSDIYLETDEKSVMALVESVIVLSDVCNQSYILGMTAPILRYIPLPHVTGTSLFQPYYIGLSKPRLKRIRIYLKNKDLDNISENWPQKAILKCTLHFMKM